MRKSTETPRFPEALCLFKFCLRVLETRKGSKVHDQEVGNILNYNPSDTSHWKRGKKAVRNIYALELLSQNLDLNSELVQDIADGVIDLDEAWYEFEEAEELRKANAALTPELRVERQKRLKCIEKVAANLLEKSHIRTVPVFLPELLHALPSISIVPGEVAEKIARSSKAKPGSFLIRYRKGDLRPHTRAAIAREIARVILFSERENLGLFPKQEGLEFLEMIDLSNALLVPKTILVSEVQNQAPRTDLIRALGEIFWVPKSVIRSRMKQVAWEGMTEHALLTDALQTRTHNGATRNPTASLSSPARMNLLMEDDSTASEVSVSRQPLNLSSGQAAADNKEPH